MELGGGDLSVLSAKIPKLLDGPRDSSSFNCFTFLVLLVSIDLPSIFKVLKVEKQLHNYLQCILFSPRF